jgi:hypothetical protein
MHDLENALRFPAKARCYILLQNVEKFSGLHPVPYDSNIGGSFPLMLKQPRPESGHSSLSRDELKRL